MKCSHVTLAVLVFSASCGEAGPGTNPFTEPQAQAQCDRVCDHDKKCDPDTDRAKCMGDCMEGYKAGRADALVTFADCYTASCGVDDDVCFDSVKPLAVHTAFETKCRAKKEQCGEPSKAISEFCPVIIHKYFSPVFMQELTACYDKPCSEINSCLDDLFEKYGLGSMPVP